MDREKARITHGSVQESCGSGGDGEAQAALRSARKGERRCVGHDRGSLAGAAQGRRHRLLAQDQHVPGWMERRRTYDAAARSREEVKLSLEGCTQMCSSRSTRTTGLRVRSE